MVSASKAQSKSRGVQKQGQVGRWARGQIVVEEFADHKRLTAGRTVAEGSRASRLLKLPTAKSREQSQNVDENKGEVQNVW